MSNLFNFQSKLLIETLLTQRLYIKHGIIHCDNGKGFMSSEREPRKDARHEDARHEDAEMEAGEETIDISATTRDDKGDDTPPPMMSPARGPMDQTMPDVPTGSTPLTRHDD
jgi:hypothetical protein